MMEMFGMRQYQAGHEDRLQRSDGAVVIVIQHLHADRLRLGVRVIHSLLMPDGKGRFYCDQGFKAASPTSASATASASKI